MNRYEIRRLNLIKLKDELCGGKIVELARRINKDQGYVSRLLYEAGKKYKKNIADRMVSDIESAFNLPRGWLDGLSADNDLSDIIINNEGELNDGVKIEVLDVKASCGNGIITDREFASVLRSIEFTPDYAAKLFGRRSTEYIKVITAKGDSMTPTIKSGANIFVDTKINYFDGDGVYVFVFDNEIYIKRIQVTGTEVIVISDNLVYEKWRLDKNLLGNFHIQGKVFVGQNIDYVYFD
ncbi:MULTISPECIES: S24 family peptidase [unclassified Gilliamella]|uniref:S24 family peptidase n=1 Tax=unclassified Gilliamella TaxID=2685620 RepID=UPI0022697EBB|nr:MULTISPECIES: S24 family peptidase [unclassified Gilliamella]MCX8602637.1 helix-turn-helix transcriptional regulator [Gilliamella sp. B3722]MCX8607773.1 helix-turn-helix transcriptional regulator [Gilliamella sp. B3771]MCX8611864.1 helix-turn-helix transcriptional regulator [Gilliamella sp. B3891]MCX8614314.1 helix-turn-helix transcriptional regulator [Gilliamella sp. B3773]MCX8615959.1 helix-turn-helix transcriptional regulator [Gilliamella sp. B3770]